MASNGAIKTAAAAAIEAAKAKKAEVAQGQATEATPVQVNMRGDVIKVPVIPASAQKPVKAKPEHSPKAKSSLGVPEENIITWVHVDNTPAFNETLQKVARARDCKVVDIYRGIIKEVMTPERIATLEAEAATVPDTKTNSLTKKTPEQLQSMADKAQKQLDAIREKLAAVKAIRLASAAQATDTEPL